MLYEMTRPRPPGSRPAPRSFQLHRDWPRRVTDCVIDGCDKKNGHGGGRGLYETADYRAISELFHSTFCAYVPAACARERSQAKNDYISLDSQ